MALYRSSLRARLSTEDANPRAIVVQPEATTSRVAQLKKETDESVAEVVRVAAEGELLTEEMETLTEEHQGLTDLKTTVESFRSEGGLNPQAAAVLNTALEGFRQRIGLTVAIPSTESFGSRSDRMDMTEVSIESISDKAKKVWEWIKKQWNRMVEWIKGLFGKKKESAEKLKERFKALKDADAPEGSLPSDAGMDFSSTKDVFYTNKLIESPDAAVEFVKRNVSLGLALVNSGKAFTDAANKLKDTAKATTPEEGQKIVDEIFKPLADGVKSATSSLTITVEVPADKKKEGFEYDKPIGYFFGGKVFAIGTKKAGDKVESVDVLVVSPEKIEGKDGKLKYPDWSKVQSSATEVYNYLDTYVSSGLDAAFDKIGEAVKNAGANDDQVNVVKGITADLSKTMTTLMGKVDTEVLSGLSKVADYYEAAKDAYKKD